MLRLCKPVRTAGRTDSGELYKGFLLNARGARNVRGRAADGGWQRDEGRRLEKREGGSIGGRSGGRGGGKWAATLNMCTE